MGSCYACIENKNLTKISHVLLQSGRKLSTDFTGIDGKNLERFAPTHVRVSAQMSNHGCVALARSTHFKLEILLHFMVHVIDSS